MAPPQGSAEASAEASRKTKKKPQGWRCMPYIIGNETLEKAASFGVGVNLTLYMSRRYGVGLVDAANIASIFFGTTNFAPLVGAFISDAYLGRFRTLAIGCFATVLGMLGMTLTASLPFLRPHLCSPSGGHDVGEHCGGATKLQLGAVYFSLALTVIGAGAVRPCSLPFGVDQFDRADPKSLRGLSSFYNWYYATTTGALVFAMTILVYVQSVNWTVGFAIPTGLMLCAIAFFFLGVRLYVHAPPEGSIFSGIGQVFVAAFWKRSVVADAFYDPPKKDTRLFKLPLTPDLKFLNRAAAIVADDELAPGGAPANTWRLCSVQQVEEVKLLLRIVPIWLSGIVCFVSIGQQFTFIILQAVQMDRHIGRSFEVPPGSLPAIAFFTLTLFTFFYDQLLVPLLRRFTKLDSGITLLQRQGVGLAIAPLSMIVAALVEKKRRTISLAGGTMTVWWLAPQLVVMGVAEAFNAVGQIEFYNKEFPEHMLTLAGSLFFCSLAGSSYVSSALISIMKGITAGNGGRSWLDNDINVGRVDYFYYIIAGMGAANLLYFIVVSRRYKYKALPSYLSGAMEMQESIHAQEKLKEEAEKEEGTADDV